MIRGIYINFEGPECGGKGEQIKRALAYLTSSGIEHETAREPGGTPVGEICRATLKQPQAVYRALQLALADKSDWFNGNSDQPVEMSNQTELMLFLASRGDYFKYIIKPKLKAGISIVGDRGPDSTWIYQGWTRFGGDEDVLNFIERANNFVMQGALPDRTFLLDLPVEETVKRLKKDKRRQGDLDRFEQGATLEFLQSIREGYLECARRDPERIIVIDASRSIDEVWAQIVPYLDQLFAKHPTL